jgi:hypothetical protein
MFRFIKLPQLIIKSYTFFLILCHDITEIHNASIQLKFYRHIYIIIYYNLEYIFLALIYLSFHQVTIQLQHKENLYNITMKWIDMNTIYSYCYPLKNIILLKPFTKFKVNHINVCYYCQHM